MIHSNDNASQISSESRTSAPRPVSDEVERLIWNYLDGSISAGKTKVLNGILERSKPARQAYVDAVESHFGLETMFRSTI